MSRSLRFLLAAAVLTAALTAAACGGSGSSDEGETGPPPPAVPEGYKGLRAVYSLTGSSFYATSFADGRQELLFNAEGDVNAATFAAWIPERSELVYESIKETGRELWLFAEESGEQKRLSQNLDAGIGVRGGREVLFASDGMDGPGLRALDLASGEERLLLKGTIAAIPGKDTRAPVCLARRDADGRQEILVVGESGDPVPVATLAPGRQIAKAFVFEDAVVGGVLLPGAGEFGEVVRWERASGRASILAQEAKLLDAAEDGGVLVQKHLRGGVSGVSRSLVAYVPSGPAASSRQPLDLGAYAGSVHAAALVADGGRALLSQRLEGTNRLELYDLATGDSTLLEQDPDLQVNLILPLDVEAVGAVRIRPGVASGGDESSAPSISSLEDEIVWIPLSADAEDVSVVSTASGPIGLLGLFPSE